MKRQTKQKEQLLLFLQQTDKAFVAKDIIQACQAFASQATVYRMIEELVETGDIVVCETDNSGYVYRYVKQDCDCHYHLVCSQCHQVYHFKMDLMDQVSMQLMQDHQFKLDHHITMQGECQACLKK